MDETTFTVTLSAILIAAIVIGIIVGFRNRTKRQQYIAVPAAVPESLLTQQPLGAAEGIYVTTVLGQELLERVMAHGLGNRSQAQVEVHNAGVAVMRAGEPNFFIPTGDITKVSTISGMAGKFVEKDGILAITWNLGDIDVTTGFRTETIAEHQELRTQLEILTNGRQTA
ncbi:PH-like domain-containing protein [Yaniella halotolerans]|uniref:PH-like domain-containing protein n=1 Tax=Yaniella halotolerans TaxID=225453 RepID=UPI0003B3A5E0|nr:hypothetical protein [Yaniella halotolerans]